MAKKETTDNDVPVIPLSVALRKLRKHTEPCSDGIAALRRAFPEGIPIEQASFDLVRRMNAEVVDFYLDLDYAGHLVPDEMQVRRFERRQVAHLEFQVARDRLANERDRKLEAVDLELLAEAYGKKKKGAADK